MRSAPHAQFSVDVVKVKDNALIAGRKVDTSESTFDFFVPGDAPVQFHLGGTGDPALFQLLTLTYLGPAR
jgi:hypothetical protein